MNRPTENIILYTANEQYATLLRSLQGTDVPSSLRCKIYTHTYTRIRVGYASYNYKPANIYRSTYEFYLPTMGN